MDEQAALDTLIGPDFDWAGPVRAEVVRVPPPANGPILMIVAGLVVLAAAAGELGAIGIPLGLGTIGVAVGWWVWKKPTWQLHLTTRIGATIPHESQAQDEVERLAAAVRERAGSAAAND